MYNVWYFDYETEFHICMYGDGEHDYEGYYLVTIDEFDDFHNPTQRVKVLYIKAESKIEVKEFLCYIIGENFLEIFGNNEKLHVSKQWSVVSKGELKLKKSITSLML